MKSMEQKTLPCLELLSSTPTILRALMSGLSEDDAYWRPALGQYSIAEVLTRLSWTEGHFYRERLDRFLHEPRPEFGPDDAQKVSDECGAADAEEDFYHFEEQRDTNVGFLRELPASVGDFVGVHKAAGEITLSQMLYEWAMHDLGAIRQVAELVRARLREGAGTLGAGYHLGP